jgi:hypothetical protein
MKKAQAYFSNPQANRMFYFLGFFKNTRLQQPRIVRGACKNVSLATLVIVVLKQSFSYIIIRLDVILYSFAATKGKYVCSQFNAFHA